MNTTPAVTQTQTPPAQAPLAHNLALTGHGANCGPHGDWFEPKPTATPTHSPEEPTQ